MEEKSSSDNNNNKKNSTLCYACVTLPLICFCKERRKHIGMKKMSYKEQKRSNVRSALCVNKKGS